MYTIFDRHTGQQIGKEYPHEEQAWAEAYERGLIMQGRFGNSGDSLHILMPGYRIGEIEG